MSTLHHANLLVGTIEEAREYLNKLCQSLGVKVQGNPDFYALDSRVFGIDEARDLKLLASRKSFGGKKLFLISADALTREAQNALLKTFEDPKEDTHFFLVVREERQVLPTLLSRMSVEHLLGDRPQSSLAQEFLSMPMKKRLAQVKVYSDKESSNLVEFLDDLLLLLKKDKDKRETLRDVYKLRKFAGDTSASSRLILEHLALVLP